MDVRKSSPIDRIRRLVLHKSTQFFLKTRSLIVQEPNSENCLDFIFVAPPYEKVIVVPDTNYITSAIKNSCWIYQVLVPSKT